MMAVREVPPRASCRILVSLESRYGICPSGLEVRALMTFPRADKDLLMSLASSNLN